jgi:hypothetical protein
VDEALREALKAYAGGDDERLRSALEKALRALEDAEEAR